MTTPETYIRKNAHGNWSAKTEIDLGESRILTIETSKRYDGKLSTNASVSKRDGNFLRHMMYQDFSRTLYRATFPRITSKVVEVQHADCLKDLEEIKAMVVAHYANKVTA